MAVVRPETPGPVLGTALATLCLAAALLPSHLTLLLEFDRGRILGGEMWRLWTAHALHYSTPHLLFDGLLLLITTAMVEGGPGRRTAWLLLLLGVPLVSCALLWLAPDMGHYRGASALAVMMGAAAGADLWKRDTSSRPLLITATVLGALKIAWDAGGGDSNFAGLPPGVVVAWQAHAAAAAIGWMAAGLAGRANAPAGMAAHA